MGLFDRILGRGGESGSEVTPVQHYYFVGNEIEDDLLNDAMVIIEHHPPRNDQSGEGSERQWSVIKCNEPINAPPDTDAQVCVYKSGSVISTGEKATQSHLAWLLNPSEIEQLENPEKIKRRFSFPKPLRGTTLPPGTHWDDEQLSQLLLSFKTYAP